MDVRLARIGEQRAPLDGVRAVEPYDDRVLGHVEPIQRLEDAARDLVSPGDAAEDVEEDGLHLRVARDHLERIDDALRRSAAAEVAEVRGPTADVRDDVDGGHRARG